MERDELKASSKACGSTIVRWIQTLSQSLMNSYQLSRPLTPEPSSRRATPFSGNGSLSRRSSFRSGRYVNVCTDENTDYVNRRNGYTVIRSSPVCNNRFGANCGEFKNSSSFTDGDMSKVEEFSCSTPNSPWARSGVGYSNWRRAPTVGGPSLNSSPLSSPLGRKTSDLGLLSDARSPGLTGRIVQYSEEKAAPSSNQKWTHLPQYSSPGQFPIVRFSRTGHSVPVLSLSRMKSARSSVRVRIAPPDPVNSRLYPLSNRTNITQSAVTLTDQSTKSVLETLKEISRKRIHSQLDSSDEDPVKRQKKNGYNDQLSARKINDTPSENDLQTKRSREDSVSQETSPLNQSAKRVRNNEILSSLSSSRILLKNGGIKRKTQHLDWSRSSTPVEKQKKRGEEDIPSEAESGTDTPVARPSLGGSAAKKMIQLTSVTENDDESANTSATSTTPATSKTPGSSKRSKATTSEKDKSPAPDAEPSVVPSKTSAPSSAAVKAASEDDTNVTVDLEHKKFCEDMPWKVDSPYVKVYSSDDVLDDPVALEKEREEDRTNRLDSMLKVLNKGAPWQKENGEEVEVVDEREEEMRLNYLSCFKKGEEPDYLKVKKPPSRTSANSVLFSVASTSGSNSSNTSAGNASMGNPPATLTIAPQALTTQSTAISTPISFGSSPWSMKPSETTSNTSSIAAPAAMSSTPPAPAASSAPAGAFESGGGGDAPANISTLSTTSAATPSSLPSFVFGGAASSSPVFGSQQTSTGSTSTTSSAPTPPTFGFPAAPTASTATSSITSVSTPAATTTAPTTVTASPFSFGAAASPSTNASPFKIPSDISTPSSKPAVPSTSANQSFGFAVSSGFGSFGSQSPATPATANTTSSAVTVTSSAFPATSSAVSMTPTPGAAATTQAAVTSASATPVFGFSFGKGDSSSSSSIFGSSQNTVLPASSAAPTTTTSTAQSPFSFGSSTVITPAGSQLPPFKFGTSAATTTTTATTTTSTTTTSSTLPTNVASGFTFGSGSSAPTTTQGNSSPFTFGGTNSLASSSVQGTPTTTSSSVFGNVNKAPGFSFPRKSGEPAPSLMMPPAAATTAEAPGFKFDPDARKAAVLGAGPATTSSSVFGSGAALVTTISGFGSGTVTSTANPFGSGTVTSTASPFGSGTPAAPAFGNATSPPTGNLFGSSSGTAAGSVFGSSTAAAAPGGGFTFGSGASAASSGSVFGSAAAASTPKPFSFGASQPAEQPKPFGSVASPQNSTNPFAPPAAQTTEQKPGLFTFGSNPAPTANTGFSLQPAATTTASAVGGFGMQPISTAPSMFSPASTNTGGFSSSAQSTFSLPTTTASSSFNFQAPNAFAPATTASSVFGFGTPAAPAPKPGIFSFGSSQQPAQPSGSGLFTFGNNAPKPAEAPVFGQPAAAPAQPAATPFQFGSASSTPQVPGAFQFGSQSSLPSNLSFPGAQFTAGTFGTGPAMFSIGSGSTAPRARSSRTRRPK